MHINKNNFHLKSSSSPLFLVIGVCNRNETHAMKRLQLMVLVHPLDSSHGHSAVISESEWDGVTMFTAA